MMELGAVTGFLQLGLLLLAVVGMIGARLSSRGAWQIASFGLFLIGLAGAGTLLMCSAASGHGAWHSSGGLLGLFSVGAIAEFGSAARQSAI